MSNEPEIDNTTAINELINCVEDLNRRMAALEQTKVKLSPPLRIVKNGNSLMINVGKICKEMGLESGDYVRVKLTKMDLD